VFVKKGRTYHSLLNRCKQLLKHQDKKMGDFSPRAKEMKKLIPHIDLAIKLANYPCEKFDVFSNESWTLFGKVSV